MGAGFQGDPTKAGYNILPGDSSFGGGGAGLSPEEERALGKRTLELARKSGYKKGIRTNTYGDWKAGDEYDLETATVGGRMEGETDEAFKQRIEDQHRTYLGGDASDYLPPEKETAKPPKSPDFTDKLLSEARTSAWNRLKVGKNLKSSFSGGALGQLDLSRPVLGGY